MDNGASGKGSGPRYAPLIYFIEEHPDYGPAATLFFEAMNRGEFQVVTSVLTLVEVLVHPLRRGEEEIADEYRDVLNSTENLTTVSMNTEIAEIAANLRSQHNLRTPDAIQVATAIHEGAHSFFTNDTRLPSLPNLSILLLKDVVTS